MATSRKAHLAILIYWFLIFIEISVGNGFRVHSEREIKDVSGVLDVLHDRGYPGEKHSATTLDGYQLTLHRIPRGRGCGNPGNRTDHGYQCRGSRPVVLLLHGMFVTSSSWLVNPSKSSLPLMLADAGYDVWMADTRGGKLSRRHSKHSATSPHYWRWSWDEVARYDLPAIIDRALERTFQPSLYLVCHGLGCTSALAALSTNTDTSDKVRMLLTMAPISRLGHSEMLNSLSKRAVKQALKRLPDGEFSPNIFDGLASESSKIARRISAAICPNADIKNPCQRNLLFALNGGTSANMNATRMPEILAHAQAGTSKRMIAHLAQMVGAKRMRTFDSAQAYDLSRVKVRVAVFSGDQDALACPKDVSWLVKRLRKRIARDVQVRGFGHLDFIWADGVRQQVYKPIIRIIRRDEKKNGRSRASNSIFF